jgi:hypothetical protein
MNLPRRRFHYENARANSKVAIARIDFARRQRYRFVSEAEVVEAAEGQDRRSTGVGEDFTTSTSRWLLDVRRYG